MSLKTKNISIESNNRDKGKRFLITEMPLTRADKWANTALLAMARGGVDVGGVNVDLIMGAFDADDDAPNKMGGILELARVSIAGLGNLTSEVGQNLLDQLIVDCVQAVSSSGVVRPMLTVDEEVSELSTLWKLRKEAFLLHTDFLAQGNSEE